MSRAVPLYDLASALMRLLPPEAAHRATIRALGLVPARAPPADDPILAVEAFGRRFANPVGLAAGFDKDADVPRQALGLGFGFVEVGTITPRPQPGNPRPRVFRLARDRAVINRYGFNSKGLDHAARALERARSAGLPGPVGVNLGKNKDSADAAADYAAGAARLAPLADYLVVNVSSPNTPGLRALQGPAPLRHLLAAVRAALPAAPPPLLLKVAPDLTEDDKADIARVALAAPADGLIVANTTIGRPPALKSRHRGEAGGLSGAPLGPLARSVLADLYRLTEGRLPLIGVGGIGSGADAYARIRAGATLVQLYTALVYDGVGLVARIKAELAALLRRDGFGSVAEAVGADHALQPG
jgi:dihydroorotate dehydrogenase